MLSGNAVGGGSGLLILLAAISHGAAFPEEFMSNLIEADRLFFERAGLDRSRIERTVADSLKGADDGELYLEYAQSEALSYDDGKLKSASFDTTQGFGLRAVKGEAAGYAHASDLSEA